MKATKQQMISWFLEDKCHLCGKDTPHTHPTHQWLSYPIPELPKDAPKEKKKDAEVRNKRWRTELEIMISGHEQPTHN